MPTSFFSSSLAGALLFPQLPLSRPSSDGCSRRDFFFFLTGEEEFRELSFSSPETAVLGAVFLFLESLSL